MLDANQASGRELPGSAAGSAGPGRQPGQPRPSPSLRSRRRSTTLRRARPSRCARRQIQATGGATNNLVALSPDPKNAVIFTILSSSVTNGITTSDACACAKPDPELPGQSGHRRESAGQLQLRGRHAGKDHHQCSGGLPLQSITWANPGTQVGGATLALNATASSGFPVTYTSSTTSVCTVTGSTVTFAKSHLGQRLHHYGYAARRQPYLCPGPPGRRRRSLSTPLARART